jgi:extracellular factor (EF) 3-hydroxypalmitic acid methyl ester biosynthesis protein
MKELLLKLITDLKKPDCGNEQHYETIDNMIEEIAEQVKSGMLSKKEIYELNLCFGDEFLKNTVQGHGFLKPYGYAGDFMIIDKIYTQTTTEKPEFVFWDKYFHQHAAPKAVRNRKDYFKEKIGPKLKNSNTFDLLNVASGPARDLLEIYSEIENKNKLVTTCVEMDENAIAYAKNLNQANLDHITFIKKNVFRFHTNQKFDLIWSAGLFDYFEDKAFVLLLKRFKNWLKPGGEIIIGNFNEKCNPSRNYMELFGDWYLNHRSEEHLVYLAKSAGFDADQISVGKEAESVNLFLHISSK